MTADLFDPGRQKRMETKRYMRTKRGARLIYNCWNACIIGGLVYCSRGNLPSGVPFTEVVEGAAKTECQNCQDWESD